MERRREGVPRGRGRQKWAKDGELGRSRRGPHGDGSWKAWEEMSAHCDSTWLSKVCGGNPWKSVCALGDTRKYSAVSLSCQNGEQLQEQKTCIHQPRIKPWAGALLWDTCRLRAQPCRSWGSGKEPGALLVLAACDFPSWALMALCVTRGPPGLDEDECPPGPLCKESCPLWAPVSWL